MAKALIGHVGGPDARLVLEMRRLQQRVRDLETELVRLQAENEALAASRPDTLGSDDFVRLEVSEPALT